LDIIRLRPGAAGIVAACALLFVTSVVASFFVQQYQINRHERLLCNYFLAEAQSKVTLAKTSAFGVTDIVQARTTSLALGCIIALPPPSPKLVILAHEFHIMIPAT
jgi:hypothetical protein